MLDQAQSREASSSPKACSRHHADPRRRALSVALTQPTEITTRVTSASIASRAGPGSNISRPWFSLCASEELGCQSMKSAGASHVLRRGMGARFSSWYCLCRVRAARMSDCVAFSAHFEWPVLTVLTSWCNTADRDPGHAISTGVRDQALA